MRQEAPAALLGTEERRSCRRKRDFPALHRLTSAAAAPSLQRPDPPAKCSLQGVCQACVEHFLRAKSSLDGWECGEGERTLLMEVDHGEDDGGVLCVDFTRLRGVSAHL